MIYKRFKQNIQRGKKGGFRGLKMGLPKLEYFTYGVQKATYSVVFGPEGSGKSSFAINSYICNPYLDFINNNKDIDLRIKYYSLEVDRIETTAKIVSWFICNYHNILCSPATLMSRGDRYIPKHVEELIESKDKFFDDFFSRVQIIDKPMSPTEIKKDIVKYATSRGKLEKDSEGLDIYKPDNPKEHVIVIFDTLSNLSLESKGSIVNKKSTIDLHSEYCRHIYRNTLKYTVCNVMHSNRDLSSSNRVRYNEVSPKKEDIIDSSRPSQEANIVIAVFNPAEYMNPNNNLSKFMGYDIPRLGNRFRAIILLKNRNGDTMKRLGTMFLGECGFYEELPSAKSIKEDDYKYVLSKQETFDLRKEVDNKK
jgi:hypothetical protein